MDHVLKSSGLVMSQTSNYNHWQFEQFAPYLRGRVLEIGCGIGNITELLIQHTGQVVSVDPKPEAVAYTRQRLGTAPGLELKNIDPFQTRLEGEPFDSILFCNVLEHIADDTAAMNECHRLLKPGGTMVLLVPSHRWLFGSLDGECGHLRRYTKSDIRSLAKSTGFKVDKDYYFNWVGALGWWANYCLLKRKGTNNEESNSQVGLFDKIVPLCKTLESTIAPPFGISLISVLKKI